MAENPPARPPVAIRIVRPYQTEDEFLEHELETVGKTSVILIGAHSRPTGVILRFEVTLASGATILRGEGRVLGFKETAFRGQPGLSLRFTRLDPKSKALVDRAAAIREARASGDPAPMSVRPSAPAAPPSEPESAPAPRSRPPSRRPSAHPVPSAPPAPPPIDGIAEALTAETPEPPPPKAPSLPPQPPAVLARASEAPKPPPPAPEPAPVAAEPLHVAPPPPPAPSGNRTLERPQTRDELLGRLRQRAASLPADRVDAILAKR